MKNVVRLPTGVGLLLTAHLAIDADRFPECLPSRSLMAKIFHEIFDVNS